MHPITLLLICHWRYLKLEVSGLVTLVGGAHLRLWHFFENGTFFLRNRAFFPLEMFFNFCWDFVCIFWGGFFVLICFLFFGKYFLGGIFFTSGSMILRLVPEILPCDSFCEEQEQEQLGILVAGYSIWYKKGEI